ncbi:hypothetical protein STANM309S_04020 [Streptomyces tanashiensis]
MKAGLDSAIVHASKILPIARLEPEQVEVALDLIHDRRREGYDPLQRLLELFEGATAKSLKAGKAEELLALPLDERLKRRIVDGEKNGLEADLDSALAERPALEIVNEILLDGMKTVGELFGSGQMQLPFVLQSAEVMKTAVAHLEPHMEKSDAEGKGTIVLATSAATSTTSARTSSTSSSPTTATTSSTSASSSRSPRSWKPPRSTAPTSSACPACW